MPVEVTLSNVSKVGTMHELSIAQSLIELACEFAEREGAQQVRILNLQIGAMAGVVADSLRFSFELAAEGTACEGAKLAIEHVPVVVHCPICNASKTLNSPNCFVCPTCNGPTAQILAGRELELISMEVDVHETTCP